MVRCRDTGACEEATVEAQQVQPLPVLPVLHMSTRSSPGCSACTQLFTKALVSSTLDTHVTWVEL